MYLFYDKDNPQQFQEDQEFLKEMIENSETKEEREYFERAYMTFIMFGMIWL